MAVCIICPKVLFKLSKYFQLSTSNYFIHFDPSF
jgi:hypothetical protein